jgi:hydrogenase maturation protease
MQLPEAGRDGGRAGTLVLGLGNDILTDDAVGLVVVREVARRLAGDGRVQVHETMEMGLALLDFMEGYESVVLVDSIQTGRAVAGTVHEFGGGLLAGPQRRTPHFLGVGETLELGRRLGLRMPEQVTVIAVEVNDPFTLGTGLTSEVSEAVGPATERVMGLVGAGGTRASDGGADEQPESAGLFTARGRWGARDRTSGEPAAVPGR